MLSRIKNRWVGDGGYKDVMIVAVPLILSFSSNTLQMFVDRVFLSRYDLNSMPAAMQAGVASFSIGALFLGTVTYISTFVAQYSGAERFRRVGPAVWQGVYFAAIAGILMLGLIFFSRPIFDWMGHDAAVREYEIIYFNWMCIGSLPMLVGVAFSCFYMGRGKTWTVLYVNAISNLMNVVLDYVLIFGKFGFPEMGIKGAAIGTVVSSFAAMIIFAVLFFQLRYEKKYASLSGRAFDWELIKRMVRFGLPSGVQFFLDMLAFSLFVAFVGRIDRIAMTATNMTFSINMLAFLPMIGMGQAVGILVGKSLGKDKEDIAKRATWSAFQLCSVFMIVIASAYFFWPDFFLSAFRSKANIEDFETVRHLAVNLLMFVAFYCLFDTGNIIFASALKGAGDTKFVMYMSMTMHWLLFAGPAYFIVRSNLSHKIYWCWGSATIFVCVLAGGFLWRFLDGKWQDMRVIEKVAAMPPIAMPENPTAESDY